MQKAKLILFINFQLHKKEADESCYWLELLKETNYINEQEFNSIYPNCEELLKIIKSIILSTKKIK